MILITGAGGFVGRYLVDLLVNKGEQVVACVRNDKNRDFFDSLGVRCEFLDVSNPEDYDHLPKTNVKAVVHLAALIPAAVKDTNTADFFKVNTIGTFNALNYAKNVGAKKFVTITTLYECLGHTDLPISEAMGRKYSLKGDHALYVLSKIAASECVEHFSTEYGLDGLVLRFTGLLGLGRQEGFWADGRFHPSAFEVFYKKSKSGLPLEIWGEHKARRDSLYVKDAVEAIYCALKSNNISGVFCIGSGEGRTNEDEAKIFAKVFGRDGVPLELIYRPELKEKDNSYYFDISKAARELGWAPKYSYEDVLRDYDEEVLLGRFRAK